MTHPIGERDLVEQTASKKPMALDSFGGRVHARWSPDEAVTPLGQLPFSSTSRSKPICSIHMLKQDSAVGTELNSSNLLMNRQ